MKTISVRVPDSVAVKLKLAARKQGRPQSAVIRDVLERYLDGDEAVRKGSCLELAADLVGCVKGPRDLSYNPKHLEGYGR